MSGFTETNFERKLGELNSSAQSIQQLSIWLIHHRKHYKTAVKVWFHALGRTPANRKLNYLYLANDVVQNSKKKSPEIAREFGTVMKKVLEHMAVLPALDERTVRSIDRLLSIWTERDIFEKKLLDDLNRIWAAKKLELEAAASGSGASDRENEPSPAKKPKKESPAKKKVRVEVAHGGSKTSSAAAAAANAPVVDDNDELLNSILDSESPRSSDGGDDADKSQNGGGTGKPPRDDPPDPEELMKALTDLENSPSSDAVVREKIAKLPASVSEVGLLENLKTPDEAKRLLQKVDEAVSLLADYNDRLQQELKDRRRVNKMIEDFLAAQKFLEAQAEERLEQHRDILEKYNAVGEELKSHVQSLPDLTKLPDVTTGGLAPLPSAGDLFTAGGK